MILVKTDSILELRKFGASDQPEGCARLDRLSVRCLSSCLFFTQVSGDRCACRITTEVGALLRHLYFFLSINPRTRRRLVRLNRRQLGQNCMQKFAGLVRGILAMPAILALGVATLANAQERDAHAALQKSKDLAAINTRAHVRAAYAQLPLIFEPNQGQSDAQVKFLARGAGYGLFLTQDSAVLSLQHASAELDGAVLRMDLAGSNGARAIAGMDLLPGSSSYFIGNDPSKWHSHIPQFAQVRYSAVYPGIDLIYYGRQGQLEYDFRVAPGSNPSQVKLHFSGAENLTQASNGDIVLATKGGDVRLHAPEIYQQSGATRHPVAGHYVLLGQNDLEFAVGAYDHSRELVIDPVLT